MERQPIPAPQEGRRLTIIAKCMDCKWTTSLPTSTYRLSTDAGLLQEKVIEHEAKFNHRVKFKCK